MFVFLGSNVSKSVLGIFYSLLFHVEICTNTNKFLLKFNLTIEYYYLFQGIQTNHSGCTEFLQ